MLTSLFEIVGKKPVPSPACYIIPQLKKIMTEYPDDYLNVYAYLFFTTCPDSSINAYRNLPEDEREDTVLADIKFNGDVSLEDTTILIAKDKCIKLYETPALRAFMGAKKMVDKVGRYLDETEITDGKDSNAMAIDRFMCKLPEYYDVYDKMETKLAEEHSKVRGAAKLAYDDKPGYKNLKEDE